MKVRKKGFTLIELIVVMAIIAILVLLGAPKYKEYTNQAKITKLMVETKELEKASQKYYITHQDWPRQNDAYTSEEVTAFAEKIYDKTGKVVELETSGHYYDIAYGKLIKYMTIPSNPENYILQNPVGNVYSLDGLTDVAKTRLPEIDLGESDGGNNDAPLYAFTTSTFTNAGKKENVVPTQADLDAVYLGTELEGRVVSQEGIQLWVVPKTGIYRIEAYGAQGGKETNSNFGSTEGGLGAIIKGNVPLIKGETLMILVGHKGKDATYYSGGGGGSFIVKVVDESPYQMYSSKYVEPIIIAGGGGGGNVGTYAGAKNGVTSTYASNTARDGLAGSSDASPGGYGFIGGVQSFLKGGKSSSFGCGVANGSGSGGGGGYSGGNGDRYYPSGGGSSYIAPEITKVATSNGKHITTTFNGEIIENLLLWNSGHGKVVITYVE